MLIGDIERPRTKKGLATKSDSRKKLGPVSCTGQRKADNGQGPGPETDMMEGSGLELRM